MTNILFVYHFNKSAALLRHTAVLTTVGLTSFILLYCISFSTAANTNGSLVPVLQYLLAPAEQEPACQNQGIFGLDEFDCDSLQGPSSPWSFVNGDSVNANIENGSLSLELTARRLWFNSSQGVFMYRNVSGNFKATTRLRVFRTSNNTLLPQGAVQLAGLMVRDPASDNNNSAENYVFIVLGFDVNDISIETKTTLNDSSTFEGPSWDSGEAELRICRVGTNYYLYKRLSGASVWEVADDSSVAPTWPFSRPDLPAEVQLGLNIYTSTNNFDVSAQFDYLNVEAAHDEADCTTD